MNSDEAMQVQKTAFALCAKARGDNHHSSQWDALTVATHAENTRACAEAHDSSGVLRNAKRALTSARMTRLRSAPTARGIVHRANGFVGFSGRPVVKPSAEDQGLAEAQ